MVKEYAWQTVVKALQAEGVERLYGLPGHPRQLYDALYDCPDIQPVLVRHEVAAVFMAMAESRLTGKPAVCFAPPGPGLANMFPGMLEAYSGCAPIILLGPGTATSKNGMGAFQEVDHMATFREVTKWSVRVDRPERVAWAMRRAFSIAAGGKPGPVYVELPLDLAVQEVEMPPYLPTKPAAPPAPDPMAVKQVVDLLLAAQRPVLVAGGGAVLAGAGDGLRQIAEMLGMPVLTSLSGRGIIPETHPLALGMTGLYFNKLSKQAYRETDLMLSVGCRHEEFSSAAWKHLPADARFVQIDIDPFEFGRNFVPELAVTADARLAASAIVQELRGRTIDEAAVRARAEAIAAARQGYEAEVAEECSSANSVPIRTKRVVWEMSRVFGRDTVLVCENGSQDLWAYYYPYYQVPEGGHCMVPAEQTCMGMGVMGAIGAKLARPDKKVVCTTGDGAFQMGMHELPTAVQYHAPVTWVILNNNSLGWIKLHSRALNKRYIAVDFDVQPDFVQIAKANRCYGEKVQQPEEIRPALERALGANSRGVPAVLEFVVEPWDFSWGFKEYHRDLNGFPPDLESL